MPGFWILLADEASFRFHFSLGRGGTSTFATGACERTHGHGGATEACAGLAIAVGRRVERTSSGVAGCRQGTRDRSRAGLPGCGPAMTSRPGFSGTGSSTAWCGWRDSSSARRRGRRLTRRMSRSRRSRACARAWCGGTSRSSTIATSSGGCSPPSRFAKATSM